MVERQVVDPTRPEPWEILEAARRVRCGSCGAKLTTAPRYFKGGQPVCSQACAAADPILRWEALWVAMAEAAKEWFNIHSVKRRHRPKKIQERFDRGEYPAQPGSYAGNP